VSDDSATETGFEVPSVLDGERVDRAVAVVTGWSRAEVQRLLADGAVLVDGERVAKSARLLQGQELVVLATPSRGAAVEPEPVPLDVRHEDADLIVLAKPAGVVVHPGAGNRHGTLANGLVHRYAEIAAVGEPDRPGIVHRLDKDTSGLLAVARTERARAALVEALAERRVDRHYVALVWGHLDAARGVVEAPIGRSVHRPTRMAVRASGRPARTHFEVEQAFTSPDVSLLRLRLESGRTHQIRVHLSAIGHPVVGDATYGGSRESLPLARPFLHATHLALDHPVTGEHLSFDDPLPSDLEAVLAALTPAG
jgi:23S rRNA pseudouridine1911/1915/1917 synthase